MRHGAGSTKGWNSEGTVVEMGLEEARSKKKFSSETEKPLG